MAHNMTVIELKEALRERGLPTGRAKAELVQRLSENVLGAESAVGGRDGEEARVAELIDMHPLRESGEDAAEGVDESARRRGGRLDVMPPDRERDDALYREVALLRRERECMQRQQELLQRELELLRASPAATATTASNSTAVAYGVADGMKELLPEFDASDNTFWRWKQQVELLRCTYQLDERSTRILITSRLRGRALAWLYSKAENMTMSIEELLREMERMFDHRPGKLALRRAFESRV